MGRRTPNTKDDYFWLNDRVAKAARWLRYIDFDRIVDERNEEAVIARALHAYARRFRRLCLDRLQRPRPAQAGRASIPLRRMRRSPDSAPIRHFCFAVFGEKSSLAEFLRPFAERHGADLFIATGELSERRAYEMARDAVRGRPQARRPSASAISIRVGYQMPVSIGVKLMAQKVLQFPSFNFIVQPVTLTLEDVIRLRLPTAMVEKNDREEAGRTRTPRR